MNFKKTALAAMLMFASASSFASVSPEKLSSTTMNEITYEYSKEVRKVIPLVNDQISKAGGFDRLKEDAANNDAHSNFVMYKVYKYGIAHDVSAPDAVRHLEVAVSANNPEALFDYGMYLMNYNEMDQSAQIIIDELTKVDPFADYQETDVDRYARGLELVIDSANLGYSDALYILGVHYLHGYFVHQDDDIALFYLSQSHSKGNTNAALMRERILGKSDYLQDFNQAQIDTKYGDSDAMVKLAQFYMDGFLVEDDHQKAIRLLSTAAIAGNEKAVSMLKKM